MVEKVLPLDLNSELQRIFLGVGKNNPYPESGLNTKSGLVTPVMMGIERQGRPLAIYVFMASGGSNALRGIECSAGDRMLCGRSAHENR